MAFVSRFTQLLIFSLLVLFIPTFLYLRPSAYSAAYIPGSSSNLSSQGHGPLSDDLASLNEDEHWKWSSGWVEPAKLKAGDYWKSWKSSWAQEQKQQQKGDDDDAVKSLTDATLKEILPAADGAGAFATKMANETAKAELGRATWRFLHTMTLRYPDHPTPSQRETLTTFFHTFSLLYPCGECANHFQALLKEMPPQTSSRLAAAGWLCAAHNKVNERLGKPEFDCAKLDDTYDCGCGPEKPVIAPTLARRDD